MFVESFGSERNRPPKPSAGDGKPAGPPGVLQGVTSAEPSGVVVYWRPRCPFCFALLRRLERRGIAHRRVNIWQDRDAAAVVRALAGGNETVPTVVIGPVSLVNPSVRAVIEAAATYAPHALPPATRT